MLEATPELIEERVREIGSVLRVAWERSNKLEVWGQSDISVS